MYHTYVTDGLVRLSLHIQLQQLHKNVVTSVNQFSNAYPAHYIIPRGLYVKQKIEKQKEVSTMVITFLSNRANIPILTDPSPPLFSVINAHAWKGPEWEIPDSGNYKR